MQQDLVFDIGLHKGEDTEFYLKKGFRVVAVEANQELCAEVSSRFASAVSGKRLTVVNKALAREVGQVTFYRSDSSIWGTLDADWAERNRRFGVESVPFKVEATTMACLLEEFGVPYYVKFDIEGFDVVGLEGLGSSPDRPRYVSIESNKVSFENLRKEFEIFSSLGYDLFKIVPQYLVASQTPPQPAQEGKYVEHQFLFGSSGLFGEEAPGRWMTKEEALSKYRWIFFKYALAGDDPINKWLSRILRHVFRMRVGWYDTHARLGQ